MTDVSPTATPAPTAGPGTDLLDAILREHAELEFQLADPAVHADAGRAKRVNRRYAELSRIVAAYEAWLLATGDLEAAQEFAKEDAAFAEEVPGLEERVEETQERLRRLLIPRDPDDARDVIMEIKGGEGGAERPGVSRHRRDGRWRRSRRRPRGWRRRSGRAAASPPLPPRCSRRRCPRA